MKNTKKKLKGQSRVVKYSFTGKRHPLATKRFCLQYLGDDAPKERQVLTARTPEYFRFKKFKLDI